MKAKKSLPQENQRGKNSKKTFKNAFADSFLNKGSGLAWVVNEKLDLVYINENFSHFFSIGQHSCTNFSRKVSEDLISQFHCYHQEVLNTGKSILTEASNLTANGHEVTFHVEIFPMEKNLAGGYAIKLAADQKRKELEQYNERLLALAEERLFKQREIAENVIKVLEKERTLIGYELHDNINQILAVVRLYVGMLNPVSNKEKKLRDKSLEQVNNAIEEVRNLAKDLVIPHLKRKGLVPSIKELIENINVSGTLEIKFRHDRQVYPISSGKKVTLFRIVQEQLRNILKHSRATEVKILLVIIASDIQLEIADNGIGFDPAKKVQGIGLLNIHERTDFYNGTVVIESVEGKGCKLRVTLPVK